MELIPFRGLSNPEITGLNKSRQQENTGDAQWKEKNEMPAQ